MNHRRLRLVEDRFSEIAEALGLELLFIAPSDWWRAAPADPSNLHRPFGYLPTTDLRTLHASPELILEQTTGLDEADFDAYLDALEVHVYKHITYFDEDDVEGLIDRDIYAMAPGSMRLLNAVSMEILDRWSRR
ncbi:MAG TPA: hypothetical protein VHC63_17180 [Acidimicrobiales bacterium]|nr:hypothetical protein [Acidimicrobiales bacterium]